jgi:hypothetical protein
MDFFSGRVMTRLIVSSGTLATLVAVVGAGRKWKP